MHAWRRGSGYTRAYVVAGAAGTGKSTLGARLSGRIGAALLDQDVLAGPLTTVLAELIGAEPGDLDDPQVPSASRAATYDALVGTAAGCLAAGVPAVLVAPFTAERSDPAAWAGLLARLRAQGGVLLVWTTCPPQELARRLAARGAVRDRRKLADLDGFLSSGALRPPAVPHVAVDTTAAVAAQIAAVLRRVPGSGAPTGRPAAVSATIDPNAGPGGPQCSSRPPISPSTGRYGCPNCAPATCCARPRPR